MKKILTTALAMLVAMMLIGCSRTGGYSCRSYYTYTNNSSREIVFKTYILKNGNYLGVQEFSFRLPIGDSYTLYFAVEGGYPYPFMWPDRSPMGSDSLNVSNGLKQFGYTQSYSAPGTAKLFREESYQIIKTDKKKRNRYYQYIFTDEDFENATPIES